MKETTCSYRPPAARPPVGAGLRLALLLVACLLGGSLAQAQEDRRTWKSLAGDGNHDPGSVATQLKQNPAEALRPLPADNVQVGNQVRWVDALRGGYIEPRSKLYPSTEVHLLDLDILFIDTAAMPFVLFPHQRHTEWLDCSNCHTGLFSKEEAGTTPVNMFTVLMGEHCGRCHGAVSFPLTECKRCHNVPRDDGLLRRGREFVQPGLSPFQDSAKVIVARPRNDPLFRPRDE